MVPGEENQLVPKEVRGRRRRLGPRPAAAASSAGRGRGAGCGPSSWAGPAVGKEEVCGAGLGGGAWWVPRAARKPGWISGVGGAETSPLGFVVLDNKRSGLEGIWSCSRGRG